MNKKLQKINEDFDKKNDIAVEKLYSERVDIIKDKLAVKNKKLTREEATEYGRRHGFLKTERGAKIVRGVLDKKKVQGDSAYYQQRRKDEWGKHNLIEKISRESINEGQKELQQEFKPNKKSKSILF